MLYECQLSIVNKDIPYVQSFINQSYSLINNLYELDSIEFDQSFVFVIKVEYITKNSWDLKSWKS